MKSNMAAIVKKTVCNVATSVSNNLMDIKEEFKKTAEKFSQIWSGYFLISSKKIYIECKAYLEHKLMATEKYTHFDIHVPITSM